MREKCEFLSLADGIGGLLNFTEDQKQCPLIKCAIANRGGAVEMAKISPYSRIFGPAISFRPSESGQFGSFFSHLFFFVGLSD